MHEWLLHHFDTSTPRMTSLNTKPHVKKAPKPLSKRATGDGRLRARPDGLAIGSEQHPSEVRLRSGSETSHPLLLCGAMGYKKRS